MTSQFNDFLIRALRGYARSVTHELGLPPERSYVQAEGPASVFLELDSRLPAFPDREAALLWDQRSGWAAAVETHSGEDLIVQAWFGTDLLPAPRAVARWVEALLGGDRHPDAGYGSTGQGHADLARRLVPYAAAPLTALSRTA
ncbi:DUF6292 family protein [Actinosynnema sp. NPDC050801]|uniref:DUF6292 family protein n=1 Tax=unclassified Actinosynnema TaxID=2637065 RepID=UPI0033C34DCF